MRVMRNKARGSHLIFLVGIIIVTMLLSPIAIDFGYYFAAQNELQTSAEASALAATSEMYRSNAFDSNDRQDDAALAAQLFVTNNQPNLTLESQDIAFGIVDPVTKIYNPASFESVDPLTYNLTGGVNAVRVTVKKTADSVNGPLNTILGNALGTGNMDTGAYSVAFLDNHIASVTNGLRPVYACQAQVTRAMQDHNLENNVIHIYGDRMSVDGDANIPGCPAPGSGNWGFADLRNCNPDAPGADDTGTWFDTGFPGTVLSNQCYSTQSGNFLVNQSVQAALNKLIANQTVINIPVYDTYSGGGVNTQVNISGFVGFVITGYDATSSKNRHIRGYFTKSICRNECTTSTDGSGDGGMMVKLRLASQS